MLMENKRSPPKEINTQKLELYAPYNQLATS
jgi:hypothetical protein